MAPDKMFDLLCVSGLTSAMAAGGDTPGFGVASKNVGRSFPPDILSFALPLAPDPADGEIDDVAARPRDRSVGVGMEASELRALFGAPKHQVSYTFRPQPIQAARRSKCSTNYALRRRAWRRPVGIKPGRNCLARRPTSRAIGLQLKIVAPSSRISLPRL
jgi:hypothetical protein